MFKTTFCSQTIFAASMRLTIARLMKANKYVLKNHLAACAFFIRSFRLLALLISGKSFSSNAIFSLAESCENSLDKLSLFLPSVEMTKVRGFVQALFNMQTALNKSVFNKHWTCLFYYIFNSLQYFINHFFLYLSAVHNGINLF